MNLTIIANKRMIFLLISIIILRHILTNSERFVLIMNDLNKQISILWTKYTINNKKSFYEVNDFVFCQLFMLLPIIYKKKWTFLWVTNDLVHFENEMLRKWLILRANEWICELWTLNGHNHKCPFNDNWIESKIFATNRWFS